MATTLSARADVFDVERVVDAAQRAGADDVDGFEYLDGLEALCASLEHEAHCTAPGRAATFDGLVQALVNQARVRAHMRAHPQIATLPVGDPVFIIGLPRTGTTLLHNVLSQHPGLRCPNLWELLTPAGPRDPAQCEEAANRAQAYVEWYYTSAPRMRVVHPMDARRPDECQRLLGNAFRTPIYWLRYQVPSYAEWFVREDLTDAYRYHRTQLQNILWRLPGHVPVLKDPFHLWKLEALARAYPEARYIHLHRDPAVGIASTCSLSEVCRGARSDHIDRIAIGRFWRDHIERAMARLPQARRAIAANNAVLDLRYEDLAQDTFATVQRVCAFLGVGFDEEAVARVRAFLVRDPLKQHGPHTYSAEAYGLDVGELRERFAPYRREYGLD